MWTSVPHAPARRTRIRTSSSRIAGCGTSFSANPGPAVSFTSALTRVHSPMHGSDPTTPFGAAGKLAFRLPGGKGAAWDDGTVDGGGAGRKPTPARHSDARSARTSYASSRTGLARGPRRARRLPPVHLQRHTGDEAGTLGRQKCDHGGELARVADAPGGNRPRSLRHELPD